MNTQTIATTAQNDSVLRHAALAEIKEVELQAIECRKAGIDDTYYEDHASFLRREFYKQFGRG